MIAMEFETLGNKTGNLEDVSRPVKTVEVPLICITTSFVNLKNNSLKKTNQLTVGQQSVNRQLTVSQQMASRWPIVSGQF